MQLSHFSNSQTGRGHGWVVKSHASLILLLRTFLNSSCGIQKKAGCLARMPSIKKRVSGFIRQFSSPASGPGADPRKRSPHSPPPPLELCFISRYLGGEARPPGPEIAHGKTGYQLPSVPLAHLDPEVFAAFTGPGGGLTCIQRRPAEEVKKNNNCDDEVDYIDLDGARGMSRRPSTAEAFGPLESLAQPGHSLSQPPPPPPTSQPPPLNGYKGRRLSSSPKPSAPKVPKSPTNCIDNTVMNIRVGDRIYRVDDSIKSPLEEAASLRPEYVSSEIVDIDEELDLVETEDGYMPLAQAKSQGLAQSRAMKRVTIKSPVRTTQSRRPSTLNLSVKSRSSFSSLNSQSSDDSAKQLSPKQISPLASPRSNGVEKTVSQVPLQVASAQSKSPANVTCGGAAPSPHSDYPELQPASQKNPASLSTHQDDTAYLAKLKIDLKDDISTSIAGVRFWNRPNSAAYGLSDTLYELHPHTGVAAGSPMADTFALIARKNSCIMVLGDGVNWGARAALASRAAVHGATDYLNQALFGVSRTRSLSTQDVFQILLRSFHAAHCLILEEEATLTTLTAACILPTKTKGKGRTYFIF